MSCRFYPDYDIEQPRWRPLQGRVAAHGTSLRRMEVKSRLPGNMGLLVQIVDDVRPNVMARCRVVKGA